MVSVSIALSQTHDVITERHVNGMKKKIMVYDGEGRDEVLKEILTYYDTGQLHEVVSIMNGKKNGELKNYYEDGNIKYIDVYVNDNPIGIRKLFYKSGALKGQTKHEEYIQYDILHLQVLSRIEDEFFIYIYLNNSTETRFYYQDGQDSSISVVNDGILDVVEYYQSGSVKREFHLNGIGALVDYLITYKNDGTILNKQFYGNEDNSFKYYENGNKKSEKIYDEFGGLICIIDYYEHGDTCYIRNYKNNELSGSYSEYDLEGRLVTITEYINGQKNGAYIRYRYDEDGKRVLRETGQYLNDLRQGTWVRYPLTGKVVTVEFRDDRRID